MLSAYNDTSPKKLPGTVVALFFLSFSLFWLFFTAAFLLARLAYLFMLTKA